MGARSTTVYDIARIAGVSAGSVSKILNGKGSFSDETRARVRAVARSEGYVANSAARSLRESSTMMVGILTPDVSNDFFSGIVRACEIALREAGYVCVICDFDNDPEVESGCVRTLLERRVDGVLLVGGRYPVVRSLRDTEVPYVSVDRPVPEQDRGVSVSNDARAMTYDMTSTLLSHGCSRIGYLTVSAEAQRTDQTPRYRGYEEALLDAGITLDRNLVLSGPHASSSYIEAERLLSGCIERGHVPDGIVAIGDRVAVGAMNALGAHGLRVGEDVRVIGMDDSLYSRISHPTLSTVRRHTELLAQDACMALQALMRGEQPPQAPIIVPHEVVERQTTLGVATPAAKAS